LNSTSQWITSFVAALSLLLLNGVSVVALPANVFHTPQLKFRTVAASAVSGTSQAPPGSIHEFTSAPVINNDGDVAFISTLAGGIPSIWVDSDGDLRLIAKAGDAAPTTGGVFAQFTDVVIADGGATAFKSALTGPVIEETSQSSIWIDRSASLTLVAQAGDEAPHPTATLRFTSFDTPIAASGDGHLAFFARTLEKEGGSAQSSGLWTAHSSALSLAANAGLQAGNNQPEVVFSPQSFEQPFANDAVISPNGQAIFRGFVAGLGVDEPNLNGLWSFQRSTGLEMLLRAGDEAVGNHDEHFLSFPAVPTINSAGDTAFLAFSSTNNHHDHDSESGAGTQSGVHAPRLGLWLRHSSGTLNQVFAIGDQAPGMTGDVRFVDTFDPIMNASSRITFVAAVDGDAIDSSNEVGLWSNGMSSNGNLQLIARQGDQAPGRGEEFSFGVFLAPSMNTAGQAAFMASQFRQENGIVTDGGFGIWGQDRTGKLQLVASVGQEFEIGLNDSRVIASIAFTSGTGGQDGKPRGFNDAGQVIFGATFTDGSSGVFVSNALTIPEPSSIIIVLLAFYCSFIRRRAQVKAI
jgi:hypothetical protein